MSKYKTAMGKIVDMSQIIAKNENVRAVGNMKVNARGDSIDSNNNITVPVTRKVGKAYQKTVSNRAANVVKPKPATDVATNNPQPSPASAQVKETDLTPEETEFMDTSEEDQEIEKIKARETKKK